VMAAALTELWSRLKLPQDAPAARAAVAEAEALRRHLLERARMGAAADWLDQRAQLGRDVFRRGRPEVSAASRGGELTDLLRACLPALRVPDDTAVALRPRPPPLWTATDARAAIEASIDTVTPREDVAAVDNREIPGPHGPIPVRVYTPVGRGPFPILLYFHGGGWVVCSIETHDAWSRHITNKIGCVVVSANYRQAPEHQFPAAVDDCFAATEWAATHAASLNGDGGRIAVAGDSAGGTLAAVVCLLAVERSTWNSWASTAIPSGPRVSSSPRSK